MGKILKLGVLAGIAGGAVYAWKKMTGSADDYGDVAAGNTPPANPPDQRKSG